MTSSTFTQLLSSARVSYCSFFLSQGAATAQWLERRTRDKKVAGLIPGKLRPPGSTFCADSYFGIRFTPVLPQ